jgi:ribonuclease Y
MEIWFLVGVAAVLGAVLGWWAERLRLERAKAGAEAEAQRIRAAAAEDAERIRKAQELAGREAAYQAKQEWEREETRRRDDLERAERRVDERRAALDRKYDILDDKERQVEVREQTLEARVQELDRRIAEQETLAAETRRRVEALAGITAQEARQLLVREMEEEARSEAANLTRANK